MTTKEYLRRARTLDNEIDSNLEQLERWKSLRERVTTTITDMPRGGGNNDALNTITYKIIELEKQLNRDIDKLVDMKTDIRKRIENIPDDRYRLVLEYYYLCGMSWERVAEETGYEVRQIYRLHGNALQMCQGMSV